MKSRVTTEHLLVLKAFYLGRAIADNAIRQQSGLVMIDRAIEELSKRKSLEDKKRLLFYYLLKAEILRGLPSVIELRLLAKELAESIKSPIFKMFMLVEDATQSKRYMTGNDDVIIDVGIKKVDTNKVRGGFWNYEINQELAFNALGLEKKYFSYKDTHFLWKVTLLELLRHHDIFLPQN